MHKYLSCTLSRLSSSEPVAIVPVSECLPGLHSIHLHWFGTRMTGSRSCALEMSVDLQEILGARIDHLLQAIVTVLAVINPVVCGSIFLTLTPRLAPQQRRWAAVRIALSILV